MLCVELVSKDIEDTHHVAYLEDRPKIRVRLPRYPETQADLDAAAKMLRPAHT